MSTSRERPTLSCAPDALMEERLRAFGEACRRGERPDVAAFLPSAETQRHSVLVRLVHADLEYRLESGQPARVEDYLARFPELLEDAEAVLSLIAREFHLRRRQEPDLSATLFMRRFPRFAGELPARLGVLAGANSQGQWPSTRLNEPGASPHRTVVAGMIGPLTRAGDYEVIAELGQGGMGVVYKARDLARGGLVALKTLPLGDAASLYRFKQEFRSLAEVTHPNLVGLYELIAEGPVWCFAMELIEGTDFFSYVRGGASGRKPALDAPVDESRLRAALRQLATGVTVLHSAGKLHRDIKPSNVLVNDLGRLVLLDFGLAAEMGPQRSTERGIVGTVAYMAPEQAAERDISEASDWYSVGVMLYQVLTGQLPFDGSSLHVLQSKQIRDPEPAGTLAPDAPADLVALCMELLRRDPAARPSGAEIRRRLSESPNISPAVAERSSSVVPPARPLFVGRERHLRELDNALAEVTSGHSVAISVHGPSGVGKTALVQHFLEGLSERSGAVVLTGRCFEQESVPYKALDSLIDSLSRYLRRLTLLEGQALLPRDIPQLARLFPVLRRVDAVAQAPGRTVEAADPLEVRRRGSAALRELLGRLGDRHPLVLVIDDLQWGDADSAVLVADLLRLPDPPALLLLGCSRSEDLEDSPFMRRFREIRDKVEGHVALRELAVESLSPQEAGELALALLDSPKGDESASADIIARESGGSPFFVHELVQHLRQTRDDPTVRACMEEVVRLNLVLRDRIAQLPETARRLLEIVGVSGGPLRLQDACRAAGSITEGAAPLSVLRNNRLIRSTGAADEDEIETYHDRVREAVLATLTPEQRRQYHLRLATTLEASGAVDPEVLALHFEGAGELPRAALYFTEAARLSAETLAFDRAARLYRLALKSPSATGEQQHHLWVGLGDALANAGRGAEAAQAYLSAVAAAEGRDCLELRQRAAMQYMISGHTDLGLATFHSVLSTIGMKLPESPRWTLVALLFRRCQLFLRGTNFRGRPLSETPSEVLRRIDVCWSAVAGLTLVDPIRGMYFQTRSLLLALRAGEPHRIARGLAVEGGAVAATGRSGQARSARLLARAEELAREVNLPYTTGLVRLFRGCAAFLFGRWQEARDTCNEAEDVFRERCTGAAWEIDMACTFSLWSLTYMGDVVELTRRRPILLKEAQERGNRFAITNLSTYIMAVPRLAAGEVEEAREELAAVMGEWSHGGFHVQHHDEVLALVLIHLYRGEGEAAFRLVRDKWPSYKSSLLLRVQQIRTDILQSRARCALAAAATSRDPRPFLVTAHRDARRLERERMPWSSACAQLIEAGIAGVKGNTESAVTLLADAEHRFESIDMRLCAAAARRRRGQLLGAEEGHVLIASADAWFASQQVKDPARLAAVYAPGFRD